jgi:hypothetical protein
MTVPQSTYLALAYDEVVTKPLKRYSGLGGLAQDSSWSCIKSINNRALHPMFIPHYVDLVWAKLQPLLQQHTPTLHVIHGDVHLGNIMYHSDTDDIRFIDPRGTFAGRSLYGIKEYDEAKLLFGVAGYSVFDQMQISSMDIEVSADGNVNLEWIKPYTDYYLDAFWGFSDVSKLFALSIWLANHSAFVEGPKKLMSGLVACYLCEVLLR